MRVSEYIWLDRQLDLDHKVDRFVKTSVVLRDASPTFFGLLGRPKI